MLRQSSVSILYLPLGLCCSLLGDDLGFTSVFCYGHLKYCSDTIRSIDWNLASVLLVSIYCLSDVTVKAPLSTWLFSDLSVWDNLWCDSDWSCDEIVCLLCSGNHCMGCIPTSPVWSGWRDWSTPLTTGISWRPLGRGPMAKSTKSSTRKIEVKQLWKFWILLM